MTGQDHASDISNRTTALKIMKEKGTDCSCCIYKRNIYHYQDGLKK